MITQRFNTILGNIQKNRAFQLSCLAVITILAAALRFYKLGEWSLWIDEIYTIERALRQYGNIKLILENIPPANILLPPSFILTALMLNIFGVSEWSARLSSVVVGILSIPVLYFPLKKMFGALVALLALLLLAIHPWHIEWSQNARFYITLMLFYTLALIFLFYGIERDRPLYIVTFFILFYFAASERYFAGFIIPVVLGYLLLLKILPFEEPPGLRPRNLLLILLPFLSAGILEVSSRINGGTSFLLSNFEWFLQYPIDDPFRLLSFISFDVGIPLMFFSILSGIYLVTKKSRAGLLLFINAVIPVVLLLALNPLIFTKSRYVFIILPSWIILGAAGIREVLSENRGQVNILALGIFVMLLADLAGTDLLYYQINNGNRHDWKGAFSLIHERRHVGDEVVIWWPDWEGYYWDKKVVLWENLDAEFVVSSGNRFWFILDEETIWANSEMKEWLELKAELIDVLYLRRENNFYLKIYLYDPDPKKNLLGVPEESLPGND